jgi:hypothetical protein
MIACCDMMDRVVVEVTAAQLQLANIGKASVCLLLLLLLLLPPPWPGMGIGYRPYPADGYPVLGWAGGSCSNVCVAGKGTLGFKSLAKAR